MEIRYLCAIWLQHFVCQLMWASVSTKGFTRMNECQYFWKFLFLLWLLFVDFAGIEVHMGLVSMSLNLRGFNHDLHHFPVL